MANKVNKDKLNKVNGGAAIPCSDEGDNPSKRKDPNAIIWEAKDSNIKEKKNDKYSQ